MDTIDSALTNTLMMTFHTDNIIIKMLYNIFILGVITYLGKISPVILNYLKSYLFTTNKGASIHYMSINRDNIIDRSDGFKAWLEYYNEKRLNNARNTDESYDVKEILNINSLDTMLVPTNATPYKINDFTYFTYWQTQVNNKSNISSIDNIVVSTDFKNKKKLIDFDIELYNRYITRQSNIYNTTPHVFILSDYINGVVQWKIRKFSSYRTIDHVWFKEKSNFLEQYKKFLNGKEKYTKRGEPWVFSCMLHGIPGCGKTSLLKSIINMDKEKEKVSHLFIIPFNKIITAEIFSEIMLNEKCNTVNIPYNQRIYVFEDFDACQHSDIFLKREYIKTELDAESDADSDTESDIDNKEDPNANVITQEIPPELIRAIFNDKPKSLIHMPSSHSQIINKQNQIDFKHKKNSKNIKINKKKHSKYIKINLADILNTLDGLIERTGQRIFWTTNKKTDIFDPAFLRPGRMDMIIEFTPCNMEGVIYILEKYYDTKIRSSFKLKNDIILTPAKLKELCRTSITIDDCIKKINLL